MSTDPLPPCNLRGRSLSRDRIVCHRSGRAEVIAAATCRLCPIVSLENAAKVHRLKLDMQAAAELSQRPPEPVALDCPHRGPVVSQKQGDLCGVRGVKFDIYQCAMHGRCALHRFCRRQEERSCVQCVLAGENVAR